MADNDWLQWRDRFRALEQGSIFSIGQFTVTASAATTTVVHYGMSATSAVFLMPLDSTTALEYGLGTTWVVPAKGQFVCNHPNNANVRKYRYVWFNGIRL